jgi:hypothetical protein
MGEDIDKAAERVAHIEALYTPRLVDRSMFVVAYDIFGAEPPPSETARRMGGRT